MDLLPHFGTIINPEIKKIVDKTDRSGLEEIDQSAMRAPRGPRKSKVIETILSVLQDGAAAANQLRRALAERGMSESSLSTGLSILQKSGQIKRDDDGAYYLSAREAA